MRPIPPKLMSELKELPYFGKCLRRLVLNDHDCDGRITLEHAIIYSGRQVNEVWAIVPLCCKAHNIDQWQDCGILDKRLNEWIALNLMTRDDEIKHPRRDWAMRRKYLNSIYGDFKIW